MSTSSMRIIGSGSAEAISSPMCACPICRNAREGGGKDVRSRSCFRVNEAVQIDCGPDAFYQSAVLGNDLTTVTDLLITHTHEDHMAFAQLDVRALAIRGAEKAVRVHASRAGCEWLRRACAPYPYAALLYEPLYRLVPVDYGEPFAAGGLQVTPLKGNHKGYGEDEFSVNYLVALEDGKMLFYASDTGYFLEETFEALSVVKLEYLVVEGTFGDLPEFMDEKTDGHMGCAGVLAVTRRLLEQGTLNEGSTVVVTHISHRQSMNHEGLEAYFASRDAGIKILVGYDGMPL